MLRENNLERMRAAIVGETVPPEWNGLCATCGAEIVNPHRRSFCCKEHFDVWMTLRLHLSHYRDQHRLCVARRQVETGNDTYGTSARLLAGEPLRSHGRWLIRGSRVHETAMLAFNEGWPIVHELPPEIREQLRLDALGGQRKQTRARPMGTAVRRLEKAVYERAVRRVAKAHRDEFEIALMDERAKAGLS